MGKTGLKPAILKKKFFWFMLRVSGPKHEIFCPAEFWTGLTWYEPSGCT
jgi:hypothetical protein